MHQRRSRAELPPSGMGPEVLELEFCAQEQEEMGEQEKTDSVPLPALAHEVPAPVLLDSWNLGVEAGLGASDHHGAPSHHPLDSNLLSGAVWCRALGGRARETWHPPP